MLLSGQLQDLESTRRPLYLEGTHDRNGMVFIFLDQFSDIADVLVIQEIHQPGPVAFAHKLRELLPQIRLTDFIAHEP